MSDVVWSSQKKCNLLPNPSFLFVYSCWRPEEFIYCQDPVDHAGNHSAYVEMGHGCVGVSFILTTTFFVLYLIKHFNLLTFFFFTL